MLKILSNVEVFTNFQQILTWSQSESCTNQLSWFPLPHSLQLSPILCLSHSLNVWCLAVVIQELDHLYIEAKECSVLFQFSFSSIFFAINPRKKRSAAHLYIFFDQFKCCQLCDGVVIHLIQLSPYFFAGLSFIYVLPFLCFLIFLCLSPVSVVYSGGFLFASLGAFLSNGFVCGVVSKHHNSHR